MNLAISDFARRMATVAAVFAWLLCCETAIAKCAPRHTLRVVFSVDARDLPADDFARRPKTLYRSGALQGRMEEELNPATGIHQWIIVNGADIWMVNRADNTGQHAVDPGPKLGFRAPLVGEMKSEYWNNFEFGFELPFMNAVGAVATVDAASGERLYEHTRDGVTARMRVSKAGVPLRVTIETPEGVLTYIYHAFEQLTGLDGSLFARPDGVRFVEAEPERAAKP